MSCVGCKYTMIDFIEMSADADRLRQFLIAHHVLVGVCFCDICFAECRVDMKRKLFRCDRKVTEKLHEGQTKVTKRHSFSKSLVAGSWFDRQKFSQKLICRFCCL